jgi:hypothetical protein
MASDEARKLHLYEHVRTAFDEDAADTLMSWAPRDPERLATKDDLALVDQRLNARIDVLEANLRGEITAANSDLLRTLFFGMIASNATLVGLVFAAVRLA